MVSPDFRMVLLSVCSLVAKVDGGEIAPDSGPYVISNGRPIPSLLRMDMDAGCATVGVVDVFTINVRSGSDDMVQMPLMPMITGQPVVTIMLVKLDGSEPVTYPHEDGWRHELGRQPPTFPGLLTFLPKSWTTLVSAPFIVWEPGNYRYTVTLENRFTKRLGWGKPVQGIPRGATTAVPNVWVGRMTFTGEARFGVSEAGAPRKVEETIERCRQRALNTDRSLSDRCMSLTTLVEMRHVYATDVLSAIERESRTGDLFHIFTVKALYDMTFHGTGYRCLPTFVTLALDTQQSLPVRVLCTDVLMTFAYAENLRHGTRVFHVVSAQEKAMASEAIQKLEAMRDQLPQELQALLSKLKPE